MSTNTDNTGTSPLHMTMLIVGVIAGFVGSLTLPYQAAAPWPIAAMLAGATLILLGAIGLGRRLVPGSPQQMDASGLHMQPATVTGRLDAGLSRWTWLVKWVLIIPHYVVLTFLWVGFAVATVAAGVAILFTGRYPAALFQFCVGVLRWNWRVSFYAYGVLATDHYPPFTLARSDYPAEFDVAYPERLSHWKVLFKSWLFALPQLMIVAAFTGGAWASSNAGISLVGLLMVIAAIILLFTGVYRLGLFNLLMGLNRWGLRTAAYVALMTDTYPPFRLDQGPLDPPVTVIVAGPQTA